MSTITMKPVPTHIITGFLGTGKTSAIMHLLQNKPSTERWAILVNEFGEVGVDGSLFSGQFTESKGIFIREVPGGCMCCTAGFSMQVALNLLLARAKPDRLFIEPTGLGHPLEVLTLLSTEYYQSLLSIQKIITLVDARKLDDQRYTDHETFNQQIQIADVIVGNKQDLYDESHRSKLEHYAKIMGRANNQVVFTEQGRLSWHLLLGPTATTSDANPPQTASHKAETFIDQPLTETGYLCAKNEGEGFKSLGFRFSPTMVFDRQKLLSFLSSIKAERMKAVFITEEGIFAYNLTPDALTEQALDECIESRIEMIAEKLNESWQSQLFDCVSQQ